MCTDPSPHTSCLVVARTFQAAAVLLRHQHKGTALCEQVTVPPLCCDGHMACPQAGPQERDPVSTPAEAFRERKRAFLLVNPGVKGSSSRSVPGAAHTTGGAGRVPVPPSCEGTSLGVSWCLLEVPWFCPRPLQNAGCNPSAGGGSFLHHLKGNTCDVGGAGPVWLREPLFHSEPLDLSRIQPSGEALETPTGKAP